MQFFEFHFNPKLKEDKFFDSFVYEPENIYEKKLGGLYIIGELENALPKNSKLLDNIASVLKENFYQLSAKNQEEALSLALKKTNEFLENEIKKDNVSWLGNLNLAVLSLNKFHIAFSKTGTLKILLLRNGQILDIGKNLELEEINPYPLKIFFNVISGKLSSDDIILVLTKEVFNFFKKEKILSKIASFSTLSESTLSEKDFKKIMPSHLFAKGEGSQISGICFLILLNKNDFQLKEKRKIIQKKKEVFSLIHIFSPLFFLFKKAEASFFFFKRPKKLYILTKNFFVNILTKNFFVKIKKRKRKTQKKQKTQKNLLTNILIKTKKVKNPFFRKKTFLIFLLILFLFSGFLIFQGIEKKKEKAIKESLQEIEKMIEQANNFLVFKSEKEANSLLKEAWQKILPLTEQEFLKENILSLKNSIEEKLNNLNKLEKIENPKIVAHPNPDWFSLPSSALVTPPPFEFNFDLSDTFFSNLYFLDKKTCEIIKYRHLGKSRWGPAEKWIKDKTPCSNPKSMTIDGSVWILNNDNSILRYHRGTYQETIVVDVFPPVENITKIKTKPSIPYLYLLEPVKKRIIVIDKTGEIIKQFQSEKFDNLKNLEVSNDGKIIWLLNGNIVYKIEF